MLPPPSEPSRDFVSWRRDRALFEPGASTVLMYHKIAPAPWATNLPFLYVSPGHFGRQMDGLAAAGLAGLTLDEAAAGRPGFCVTFDDGFCNVFERALPLLQSRGLRAIQFIVAGLIGGEDAWDRSIDEPVQRLMDETQIREWLAAGHEIGAHTMTHPHLSTLPLERARAEIVDSKRLLEDRFGREVRHFCYPYGDYNEAVRELVGAAGYASACTVAPGINRPGGDALQLHRAMACDSPLNLRQLAARARRRLSS